MPPAGWSAWVRAGLDWVYPPKCALCGRIGPRGLCEECREEFVALSRTPARLGSPSPLSAQASLFRYEGRARQAVRRLKFDRATSLGGPMAALLAEGVRELGYLDWEIMIPVPIHWRRRWTRGFNQSELLAAALPRQQVRPRLLRRVRATKPQAGLQPAERMRNVRGAFRASPEVGGRRVLLIDDVLTSGGTATACALALRTAGATDAAIVTFAGWGSQTADYRE
jgi:ComF family protein